MAEGREWMYNRISRTSGNINLEFVEGVNHFLDYAFTIAQRNGESMVKCPCTKCKLRKYFDRGIIKTHLCKNGFREQYYIWDCHGEERPINPIIYRGYTPINVDSFESTTTIDNYDEQNHVLGCTQMVREVMHPLYIGSANDENDFNTFGLDDDEETRFETNEIQNPNKNAEEFYKLLEDASAPLYDGCTSHTRLSVVAELLSVKSQYNMSDACYDKVASIVERIVPGDNHLPKSFYQSKKMIHGLGLPYFKIDACENNCMLFDGNDKDLMYCKDEYKWAPSDSGKMRSHLHSQFSTRYQARMSNIRVNILQNHIHDFAQDPDYKRFIPFRPQHVTPETWIKLCDYWNTDEWKKKSKVGKRNRAGNLREGERPAKTKGRKSKEILFSEIEIEIGRKPTFLDFAEKWVVADTSTSEPVPTSFAVHMVTYRQRMEEMYGLDRTKYPPFDSQLWKEITGDPKKGRWVGVPAQLSHPELFQPSKPLEDTYGLLDDRIVKMEAEIETMRVGMSELKEQNETMRLENTEQRTSFTTAMRNIWAILISMGVTNSNLINHQFLPGGSSTNQCTSSLFAQQKLNPMPPFGQQQQPGSFGQLLEMNYAQAHLFDQPSPFAATGHPQPPSSNPHITTLHQAGATRGTPSFPVRQLRDESSSSDDDSEE